MENRRFQGDLQDGELYFAPYSKNFFVRALERAADGYRRFTVEHSYGPDCGSAGPVHPGYSSRAEVIANTVLRERQEILWKSLDKRI
jgi:hypothetical protein